MSKYNVQALVAAAVVSTVVSGTVSMARLVSMDAQTGETGMIRMELPMPGGELFRPMMVKPMRTSETENNNTYTRPMPMMMKYGTDGLKFPEPQFKPMFAPMKMKEGMDGGIKYPEPNMRPSASDEKQGTTNSAAGNEMSQWRQMRQDVEQILNEDESTISETEQMILEMEETMQRIETRRAALEQRAANTKSKTVNRLLTKQIEKLDKITAQMEEKLAELEASLGEE